MDALLDDPAFFTPFVPFFDPRMGRPSTPMETYLRLMFLKFRYRLGYESLCREVSDSITWRMFCRIALDVPVPHPTTLMKLTSGAGRRRWTGSTRRCWRRRPKRNCCAPTECGPTRRWCRRTWPIPPTPGCWPRRCSGSRRPLGGSRPPVARCAPGSATGRGQRQAPSPPTAATARNASMTPLHDLGVRTVVITRKGKPGQARQAEEHRRRVPTNNQMAHGLPASTVWSSTIPSGRCR